MDAFPPSFGSDSPRGQSSPSAYDLPARSLSFPKSRLGLVGDSSGTRFSAGAPYIGVEIPLSRERHLRAHSSLDGSRRFLCVCPPAPPEASAQSWVAGVSSQDSPRHTVAGSGLCFVSHRVWLHPGGQSEPVCQLPFTAGAPGPAPGPTPGPRPSGRLRVLPLWRQPHSGRRASAPSERWGTNCGFPRMLLTPKQPTHHFRVFRADRGESPSVVLTRALHHFVQPQGAWCGGAVT